MHGEIFFLFMTLEIWKTSHTLEPQWSCEFWRDANSLEKCCNSLMVFVESSRRRWQGSMEFVILFGMHILDIGLCITANNRDKNPSCINTAYNKTN